MPLWKNEDSVDGAPKFVTNAATGETGADEYGTAVIYVYGDEGYPVATGWARKTEVGSRTIWESLVSIANPIEPVPDNPPDPENP